MNRIGRPEAVREGPMTHVLDWSGKSILGGGSFDAGVGHDLDDAVRWADVGPAEQRDHLDRIGLQGVLHSSA